MPHFTIGYSGSGTGVLRVECVTVEDAAAAMAEARRRLAVSRTFSSAEVFDDEHALYRRASRRDGVSAVEGGEARTSERAG
ncbi:hypothetical protein [Brevundimonas naejangsanensis]|uniref:hypothetical protein n=1 Tax=Brevundimonas naejangsanensis TaxID=588932 RepID=UPI003207AF82